MKKNDVIKTKMFHWF